MLIVEMVLVDVAMNADAVFAAAAIFYAESLPCNASVMQSPLQC